MTGWLAGWLDDRSALAGLITALVGAAGVGVAWYYAILTRRLWRATLRQARQSRRQADTTQRMFEASYRPYLELWVRDGSYFVSQDAHLIRFTVRTHGQVPAFLTRWHARVRGNEPEYQPTSNAEWRRCVFPGQQQDIDFRGESDVAGDPRRFPRTTLEITVEYRGAPNTNYRTKIVIKQMEAQWLLLDQEVI